MGIRLKIPVLFWFLFSWVLMMMVWWGFAFLPLPSFSPDWVERARQVCFGLMSNGLHASYGWLLLLGAPFMMLSAILVLWGHEKKDMMGFLYKSPKAYRLVLVFLILFVGEIFWAGYKISKVFLIPQKTSDFYGVAGDLNNYSRLNQAAPFFELIDQNGKRISLDSEKGKVIYLTFAYAHCQTMCPALAHDVRQAVASLGEEKSSVFFVTLDPWRDTPTTLPSLMKQWELPSSSHVLSGSPEDVEKVLEAYHIPRGRDEKTGDISHPAIVYVIQPHGQIAYVFNHASATLLEEAGKKLLQESR